MAGHLPPGVHTRIGAPRHGQRYRLAEPLRKGVLDHLLHRALARLAGPAGEPGPVVLEQQPGGQPRLRATIRRYSTSTENAPSPPAQPRTTPSMLSRSCAYSSARHRLHRGGLHRRVDLQQVDVLLGRAGRPRQRAALHLDRVRQAVEALAHVVLDPPLLEPRLVRIGPRPLATDLEELGGAALRRPGGHADGVARAAPPGTAPRPPRAAAARSSPRTPSRRTRSARPRTAGPRRRPRPTRCRSPRPRSAARPFSTIPGARSDATTLAPSRAHSIAKLPSPAATSSTSCPRTPRTRRRAPRPPAAAARTATCTRPSPTPCGRPP